MVSEVVIPILDQTTTDVLLLTWHKNEGDAVCNGEVICEIETDKATVEIEAPSEGILRKILIKQDTTIPPLTVVALVAGEDEVLPDIDPYYRVQPSLLTATAAHPSPEQSDQAAKDYPSPTARRIGTSPRARRLADEHKMDITTIVGHGPHGRILEDDVRQALEKEPAVKMSRAEQATAERVSLSWNTIPHFYTSTSVDMSHVVAQQKEWGDGYTYTDFIALAIADALGVQSSVNGHWKNGGPEIMDEIHLGLVVQTSRGLVIPTLRNLQNCDLKKIAAYRTTLVQQAHEGRLSAASMTQATFTMSNLGPGHIDHFTAIISPPQLAILSVGSVQQRPLVIGADIVPRPTATFTLSVDHRVIDGRSASAFLEALKTSLEKET